MGSNSTDKKEIRRFGLIAAPFFGSLCALGVWRARTLPIFLFGFLAFLGVCFLLFPGPFRPVHAAWLKVAHGVGRLLTAFVLTLAYYLVITPSAWLKRIFGGRPLPMKPDKKASSYWVTRSEPAQPQERFVKRY